MNGKKGVNKLVPNRVVIIFVTHSREDRKLLGIG